MLFGVFFMLFDFLFMCFYYCCDFELFMDGDGIGQYVGFGLCESGEYDGSFGLCQWYVFGYVGCFWDGGVDCVVVRMIFYFDQFVGFEFVVQSDGEFDDFEFVVVLCGFD